MASDASNDTAQLLRVFPNETWANILENVRDAPGYHKICGASDLFRNYLYPRAQQILFFEVAKLLLQHDPDVFAEDNFWIVARQVCRAWKRAIYQMVHTTKYVFREDCLNTDASEVSVLFWNPLLVVGSLQFYAPEEFTEFEEHFDSTHLASETNPFVCSSVQFYINDIVEFPEFYFTACLRFLKKYGKHIQNCILSTSLDEPVSLLDFYNLRLQFMLELMPTLQALVFKTTKLQDNLDNQAFSVSLPHLPFLEYISVSASPLSIVQELLQKNPQVHYVDAIESPVTLNVFLERLPNLRALASNLWIDDDFRAFTSTQFTSPVERLWLDMSELNLTNEQVFEALEHRFSKGLVEIHISLPHNKSITAETRLQFPRLKLFCLQVEQPQRLDLLLPLKETLEQLHLTMNWEPSHQVNWHFDFCTTRQDDSNMYGVQKNNFCNDPQKSNIWSYFSNLRVLRLHLLLTGDSSIKFICTRKEQQVKVKTHHYGVRNQDY